MARLHDRQRRTGCRIAIIDDDPELLGSMRALLAREGHEVYTACDALAGVELVRSVKPEVVLLDYCMPGLNGAEVVRLVRAFDVTTQVLLVTGYASEQPARKLLAELDIQGYHDKADGPERLLVLIDAARKHASALQRIERNRRYLRRVLDVAPDLARLRKPEELFGVALAHLAELLGGGDGIVATENNGLFVLDAAREGVSVRAGTGRYGGVQLVSDLPSEAACVIGDSLAFDRPTVHPKGFIVIPLSTRDGHRGCMVVEGVSLPDDLIEPCEVYAQQVMQALENALLYDAATVDPLTRAFNRGFGFRRLEEALSLASRMGSATSVIMVDLDHFKLVNDRHGHAAGDLVLRAIGRLLLEAVRVSDIVARYGGEELLIILPDTGEESAVRMARRVGEAVRSLDLQFGGKKIHVTASLGTATSAPGQMDAERLVQRADGALYRAKAEGRDCVRSHVEPRAMPVSARA